MRRETPETLEALKHYGIRVTRAKRVDSAEAAIAFAARRTADDPRMVPVELRAEEGEVKEDTAFSRWPVLRTEAEIRQAYAELSRKNHGVICAEAAESGTDITITAQGGAPDERTIALRGTAHSIERMVPLGTAAAEMMALNYEAHHHHGASESTRRMLEHLLLRVSDFFEQSGAASFSLLVRLHENSYTVVDARLKAPGPLDVKGRLDAHAHDRKGNDYHPAGRQ